MTLTSPMAALVKREFISLLRGRRAFFILVLFVAVCSLFVCFSWPEQTHVATRGPDLARILIGSVINMLFLGCALFVPALGATSIVVEREQDTFDMLRSTILRPSGILFAKLLNTVGFFLLLFIAVAPVASTVFFLLGIDISELFAAFLMLLATAFSCGIAGVYASARYRRTFIAIGMGYVVTCAALFGGYVVQIPFVIMAALLGFGIQNPAFSQFPLAPGAVISNIVNTGGGFHSVSWGILYQIVFFLIIFRLATKAMRHVPPPPKFESEKPIDDPAILRQRRLTWPFYLIDPLARKKPIEDNRNPMMVRELRWGVSSRGTFLVRTFLAVFVLCFLVSFGALLEYRELTPVAWWFMTVMILMVAIAPAFLANTLTKEYELGNIDMLRMTLLTPHEIVTGKFAAGVLVVTPLFCAALATGLGILALGNYTWRLLVAGYLTLAVCILLCVALGLSASILTKRTSNALVLGYLFAIAVFAGPPLFGVFYGLQELVSKTGQAEETFRYWFAYFTSPIQSFTMHYYAMKKPGELSTTWFANLGIYALICLILVRFCINQFRKHNLRDR